MISRPLTVSSASNTPGASDDGKKRTEPSHRQAEKPSAFVLIIDSNGLSAIELNRDIIWFSPDNSVLCGGLDDHDRVACPVKDVTNRRTLPWPTECAAVGQRSNKPSFSFTQWFRTWNRRVVDVRHFLNQCLVVLTVPRFIQFKLVVQLGIIQIRQNQNSPAQQTFSHRRMSGLWISLVVIWDRAARPAARICLLLCRLRVVPVNRNDSILRPGIGLHFRVCLVVGDVFGGTRGEDVRSAAIDAAYRAGCVLRQALVRCERHAAPDCRSGSRGRAVWYGLVESGRRFRGRR